MTPANRGLPSPRPASGDMPALGPAVYTVEQAAELLGVARSTAYELVRDAVIPARRLGGRWVISRARFHAWLDADTTPAWKP